MRTFTEEQLREIIESHGRWLRDEEGGKRADLSGSDLRGSNLRGSNLSDSNLSGSNLDKKYYQVVRIGSRKGTTTYNATDDIVLCGCWNGYEGGTLDEFTARVEREYGEEGIRPHKQYYAEYMAAIEFFKKVREM